MSKQQPKLQQQFVEHLGQIPHDELSDSYENNNLDGVLIDATETIALLAPQRQQFAICDLAEYEDTNSWSMGYVDIDDDTTAVYIVDAPYDDVLAINANKIEAIADITGQTPAAVADSIQIEGYKPVAIPYNGFTFIVAPIMNADVRDEQ
jgi:hypothetical protein